MLSRFNRNYRLYIKLDNRQIEIKPPLRIQFQAKKTIEAEINELHLKIFNLEENKRIIKDKSSDSLYIQVLLQIGYENTLVDVYQGNIFEAGTQKNAADYITEIVCKDGGYDFKNSFTSKTISKNVNVVDELLKDFKYVSKGTITSQPSRVRDKILVGNTMKLIEQNLSNNENYYVDNEKLNIIKNDEVIENIEVEVSSKTGLLNLPLKRDNYVIAETLLNPLILCGSIINLKTKKLDGKYRVETIDFLGDYRGFDWKQTLFLRALK